MVHEHDTQGALLFVERLNQSGTDYNQFMKDLLNYLRDMYIVKHTADTPPSIALSEEQLDALRAQANRVPIVRTVTFIDLLGEALRAVRQGSDPRLELELALIKMTAFGPGGSPRMETEAIAATPAPRRAISIGEADCQTHEDTRADAGGTRPGGFRVGQQSRRSRLPRAGARLFFRPHR